MSDKWSLLRIFYKNGDSITEKIDEVDFWTNAKKDNIVALKIKRLSNGTEIGLVNTNDNNYQFFSFKRKVIVMGNGKNDVKEFHGIGMITDVDGNYHGIEIAETGKLRKWFGNVIDEGRNLKLHGVKLEEIE